MTTKKKIDLLKTSSILEKYPIILFCQHNNLTVTDWSNLRINISKIKNTKILIIKNSIIEKILVSSKKNKQNLDNIFQGPNFLIGCQTLDDLDSINKYIKSVSNIIFIGGLFKDQLINHLDLDKFLELKNSGFSNNIILQDLFYNTLNINSSLCNVLNNNFNINILTNNSLNLINYLDFLKFNLGKTK